MANEFDIFAPLDGPAPVTFGSTVPPASKVPTTYRPQTPYADTIQKWAQQYGVDPNLMMRIAKVESGFDPRNRTGSYKGLFQLSDSEFNKFGGGNIWNPEDNARAAAAKLANETATFKAKYDRAPSPTEIYMLHQQGEGGLDAHLRNPDAPAWQNMLSTAEGRQKGPGWSQKAIWGNVPTQDQTAFGNVQNLTSRQYLDLWGKKIEGRDGSWGSPAGPAFAKTLGTGDPSQMVGTLTPSYLDASMSGTGAFVPPSQRPGSSVEALQDATPQSSADALQALADASTNTKPTSGLLDVAKALNGGGEEWAGPFKPINELNLLKQPDLARLTPGLARARAAALRGVLFKGEA